MKKKLPNDERSVSRQRQVGRSGWLCIRVLRVCSLDQRSHSAALRIAVGRTEGDGRTTVRMQQTRARPSLEQRTEHHSPVIYCKWNNEHLRNDRITRLLLSESSNPASFADNHAANTSDSSKFTCNI